MDQAEQLRNVIKVHNQNNMNTARVVAVTSGKVALVNQIYQ